MLVAGVFHASHSAGSASNLSVTAGEANDVTDVFWGYYYRREYSSFSCRFSTADGRTTDR